MTRIVPLSSILIREDRQRRDFDEAAHQELVASIEERGLLHAPVVRAGANGATVLVAGERRIRALKELAEFEKGFKYGTELIPVGSCPVLNFGQLPPLEAKELELEENIRRSNLSWQEQVAAEAELMELRKTKAEIRGDPPPKPIDLAMELRGRETVAAAGSIQRSIILAKNLDRPEVAKAKSQSDAWKALMRAEESELNARLAGKLGPEHLSQRHRLIQGDCLTWLAAAVKGGEEEFDVICSDPPYGMGADGFGDSGGLPSAEHFYEDSPQYWFELMRDFIPAVSALAKPNAHLYLFCDLDNFHNLRTLVAAAGWKPFRTPLIWFKPSAFRAPWPEKGPQRKYETILYAVRGELKCTAIAGDVLTYQPDENLGHPAQKPVALYRDLLGRSVRAGMKVIDPFCGTGPIFEAAHALSAFATGIENNAAAGGIAAGRLKRLAE